MKLISRAGYSLVWMESYRTWNTFHYIYSSTKNEESIMIFYKNEFESVIFNNSVDSVHKISLNDSFKNHSDEFNSLDEWSCQILRELSANDLYAALHYRKFSISQFWSRDYKLVTFECFVVGKNRNPGGHQVYSFLFLGQVKM